MLQQHPDRTKCSDVMATNEPWLGRPVPADINTGT
jgi:hypothetical protein